MMNLTREQRMLNVINRKSVDFLPSNIAFSDKTRDLEVARALGLESEKDLEKYLDNHLSLLLLGIDKPIAYHNDEAMMVKLQKMGLAGVDWNNRVVYDCWGVGIMMDTDGFCMNYHPLQQKFDKNRAALEFMPRGFNRQVLLETDLENAVDDFVVPDALSEINFKDVAAKLQNPDGEYLYAVCGYGGMFERSYHVIGFEEMMVELALNPEVIEKLFDKVIEHKMQIAQRAVELGAKLGHFGDDLGTQTSGLISVEMFRNYFKPRYAKLFNVYKKAGIPVMMHSCGNIAQFIPDLIDIGLDVLEPTQPCMDLKFIKREYGKDLTFYGGIDTQLILPTGSPDQVRQMVKETIHILGKGGGYIVAPAQEIMSNVPIENIKALVETVIVERERVLNI